MIKIKMSDFQFGVYEEARIQERKLEERNSRKRKRMKPGDIYEDSISTYRTRLKLTYKITHDIN